MNFFDLIFGKTITREDEVFGKMTYEKFKDPSRNYFIAYVNVLSNSNKVSIYIDADENGPTKNQKEFFENFLEKYKNLIPTIKIVLDEELKDFPDFKSINDFENEFVLESLQIPRNVEEINMLNVSYYSQLHPELSFDIKMKDDKVISISIDS